MSLHACSVGDRCADNLALPQVSGRGLAHDRRVAMIALDSVLSHHARAAEGFGRGVSVVPLVRRLLRWELRRAETATLGRFTRRTSRRLDALRAALEALRDAR